LGETTAAAPAGSTAWAGLKRKEKKRKEKKAKPALEHLTRPIAKGGVQSTLPATPGSLPIQNPNYHPINYSLIIHPFSNYSVIIHPFINYPLINYPFINSPLINYSLIN
jgi:hypothetical protein